MKKTIEIIAGPNGSGKTSLSELVLLKRRKEWFFNSDRIAQGFAPEVKNSAQFEAGRVMLRAIEGALKKGESFSFETTFSGKLWRSYLVKARKDGYRIVIYFVFVQSIELSLKRIRARVKMGGHDVPAKIVRRRFKRTFDNFIHLYMPLADEWYIVDNTNTKRTSVIAQSVNQKIQVFEPRIFKKFFNDVDSTAN